MLFWLLQRFAPLLERVEILASGDSRVFTTARIALASLTSFLIAMLCGPAGIRWLRGRFRERIASDSAKLNELHAAKARTPTMGGLLILAAMLGSVALWANLGNAYVPLTVFVAVGFGGIGAYDDWVKLRTSRNGLTARQKFAAQWLIGLVAGAWLFGLHSRVPLGTDLVSPFGGLAIPLGFLFIAWSALVLVSLTNGVNLTDGLDGLAAGCVVFAGTAFVALTYVCGHRELASYLNIPHLVGAGEASVMLAAMVGAVLGFLWFNCHPAEVFMGDTGSLTLGGVLGLAALICRQEVLLVIIGGVFVVETLSVILQVSWYRRTKRRLLRCSPLHNHFVFAGMPESKIVTRFWIVSALLAIAGLASLKIR